MSVELKACKHPEKVIAGEVRGPPEQDLSCPPAAVPAQRTAPPSGVGPHALLSVSRLRCPLCPRLCEEHRN